MSLEHFVVFRLRKVDLHLVPSGRLSSRQPSLPFDHRMRVKNTVICLTCQFSSNLMQLLFSFDQDMRVEKTLIQTLACQL